MFGDGIFTQEGADWKHSRDLLRLQMQRKSHGDLESFRVPVDDLIRLIGDGRPTIDLQPLFFRLTLETTTSFLFGESTRRLSDTNGAGEDPFASALDTAQRWVIKRLRFAAVYWLVDSWKFRQACRDIRAFVDQIIERSETHRFPHSVAQVTPDRSALRAHTVSILVAGRDTTASLLSWTW